MSFLCVEFHLKFPNNVEQECGNSTFLFFFLYLCKMLNVSVFGKISFNLSLQARFCTILLYKYTFGCDFIISGGVFYVRVRKPNTNQIQELMNTILTVFLQISGDLRTEVNSFLSEYAVPVIAMLLIVGVGIGVVMNYDKIIDRDGQGTRKEGIVNLLWVVGYIIIGLAIIAAVIALVNSKLKMSL